MALGVLALLLLAASSSQLTAGAVRDVLARAQPAVLVAAVTSMTTGLVFLALRWRAMMPDPRGVTVLPLTGIFTIGTLLNYALPGPVGEVVAAAMAGKRWGMPAETALAASVHARFIGLAVAGTVAGVLFLTTEMPVPEGMSRWVGAATFAIAGGAIALGALAAFPRALRGLFGVLFA
ncbi:MAG: lysylphosphatidylglycerol synthase domain-containing protein, partial [Myxococcota bacterium]